MYGASLSAVQSSKGVDLGFRRARLLSAGRPDSFSKGNEFSQRLDLHFLHHAAAVGL
jgi:hypothetical protein